jgi:hypothetical protein
VAVRAGSYSESVWHGILRDDRYPIAVCFHSHKERVQAQECARDAKVYLNANDNKLPEGWAPYTPSAVHRA